MCVGGVYSTYCLELVFWGVVWEGSRFFAFFFEKKDERCYEILKSRKIIKVEERIKKASLSYISFRYSLLHAMAGASRGNNEKQNHTLIPSTVVSFIPSQWYPLSHPQWNPLSHPQWYPLSHPQWNPLSHLQWYPLSSCRLMDQIQGRGVEILVCLKLIAFGKLYIYACSI